MGGMIRRLRRAFRNAEIADASYRYQREIEREERVIVGANRFQSEDQPIDLLEINQSAEIRQREKLAQLKRKRDNSAVSRTLSSLAKAAQTSENTMPYLLDAVRTYATLGEICETLRGVFGTYTETIHI